jgi:EAL domain-containing protein (putative c-di-GMP-specific phosphodiesterase class I)
VNVSPVQFNNTRAKYGAWRKKFQNLGLNGKSIVVEITEGLLLEANNLTKEKLIEFSNAGVQIAIDDFGTGYSSLSYLKKFEIDYIKIDQSFVRNMTANSGDFALCEAMVVMAHKLGIEVIAEGVETLEQSKLLSEMGCDFAQGYYFAKPMQENVFLEWLKNFKLPLSA